MDGFHLHIREQTIIMVLNLSLWKVWRIPLLLPRVTGILEVLLPVYIMGNYPILIDMLFSGVMLIISGTGHTVILPLLYIQQGM
jgi:hypothetical protein